VQGLHITIPLTRTQARPPMVFSKLFNSIRASPVSCSFALFSIRIVSSPFNMVLHAKFIVPLNDPAPHSTMHSEKHVTNRNHGTAQCSGEYKDRPFHTGNDDRRGSYRSRARVWFLQSRWLTFILAMRRRHAVIGDWLRSYSRATLKGVYHKRGLMVIGMSANAGSGMVLGYESSGG